MSFAGVYPMEYQTFIEPQNKNLILQSHLDTEWGRGYQIQKFFAYSWGLHNTNLRQIFLNRVNFEMLNKIAQSSY